MVTVANFAKRMAKRIAGDVHGVTVDEIEFDKRSNEWVVTVGFWLPTPVPKRGAAIIGPTAVFREARILRIGSKSPARLVSMKVKQTAAM
jgi:hypothetical protein